MLWGRTLYAHNQSHAPSIALLRNIFDGNAAATANIPPQPFTDVHDSALLHVAALILPDVREQRLFAATTPYTINSLLSLLRHTCPARMFPGDVPDHGADESVFRESGKAEELLRRMGRKGWTDLETSVRRNIEAFLS